MRQHPLLLEIAAWPWLERLSHRERRLITLADVPAAQWDACAQRGFDCLFLMGVWRRSAIGREIARGDTGLRAAYDRALPGWTIEDVVGSPYCIQAYEPDERMGGWSGLDIARRQLGDRGIKLMLDFVPNHTAFDHAWITDHPERYVLGTRDAYERAPNDFRPITMAGGQRNYIACGRDPHFPPWTDVAQLNYFNADTRQAMVETLRSIASNCDGVRCDMAMLVFNDVFERTWRSLIADQWPVPRAEFWPEATRAVPQLVYLAEVYWDLEHHALEQGFNYAYDKRLLDALHSPDPPAGARAVLSQDRPEPQRLARFLENHDEPRSAATLGSMLPACAALLGSVPGIRFFYDGQFEGHRVKAPVQLGRWPEESVEPTIRDLYDRVLGFAITPVLREGAWRILNVTPAGDDTWRNFVAYRWRLADALAVITLNLGTTVSEAHIDIRDDLVSGSVFDFDDLLSGNSYPWTRQSLHERGLWVRLDAGQAHLFIVRSRA